jgi:large subunit ribosomal protein L21
LTGPRGADYKHVPSRPAGTIPGGRSRPKAAARAGVSPRDRERFVSDIQQAIIRTGGKQYRVSTGAVLRVEKLPVDAGAKVNFEVLLVGQGEAAKIGKPVVAGASVVGEVLRHGRGKKLVVYKMRKRTNYRKKQGHRQAFTEIKITTITA